jgi:signal transduction histidine kinase
VKENGDRLLRLINDLLDLSRIEAGKEEIRATRFRLDTLIHETLEALRPVAEENGVTIAAPGPPSVVIRADRDKISRVIMNLVHNAIKFSPRGGQVQVAASGEGEGEWVTLAVRDSGPGIPAGEVDRIFDKFHQVKRNRGRGGAGSGLGLPISRQLVEMHGGRLTVESAVGQGSTFTVVLPLSAQAERGGEGSESWRAS